MKIIPQKVYDVIVIGAGAAGLMAAGTAADRGRKVLLIEKMEKAGRKIRITGKGRCNLTNTRSREEFLEKIRSGADFFSHSLDRFSNRRTVDFFRKQGLRLTEERGLRVFPSSGRAWDVADTLVDWVVESGVEIMYHTSVTRIRTVQNRVCGVTAQTRRGFSRNYEARNVIIATGGVSYPATGSTGDGYNFAHELGHRIEEVRPSLVPLESNDPHAAMLKGLKLRNVNATLYLNGEPVREEFGEMEFGSRGIEGAVILRLSRDAVDAIIAGQLVEISIDLKPALETDILLARFNRETEQMDRDAVAGDLLRKLMPAPMIAGFAAYTGIDPKKRITDLDEDFYGMLAGKLKDFRFVINDYRPFEEAVVTAGGISLDKVNPDTLESRLVKGLYFAGEVLDIDGDTGGYNLQVAFSTGFVAGHLSEDPTWRP